MIETYAALRAEALARAAPDRIQGPRLPRPRNRLRERLLALLGHAPAAPCKGAGC